MFQYQEQDHQARRRTTIFTFFSAVTTYWYNTTKDPLFTFLDNVHHSLNFLSIITDEVLKQLYLHNKFITKTLFVFSCSKIIIFYIH
jgi:hypothetical protein